MAAAGALTRKEKKKQKVAAKRALAKEEKAPKQRTKKKLGKKERAKRKAEAAAQASAAADAAKAAARADQRSAREAEAAAVAPKKKKGKKGRKCDDDEPVADAVVLTPEMLAKMGFSQADVLGDATKANEMLAKVDLKAAAKENEEAHEKANAESGEAAEEEEGQEDGRKNRYILFMGNLSYGMTAERVVHFFRNTDWVQVRMLTKKGTGEPKGCCFVEFSSAEALQRGLLFHNTEFDGRKIRLEVTAGGGGNGENRRQKIKEKQKKVQEFMKEFHEKRRERQANEAEDKSTSAEAWTEGDGDQAWTEEAEASDVPVAAKKPKGEWKVEPYMVEGVDPKTLSCRQRHKLWYKNWCEGKHVPKPKPAGAEAAAEGEKRKADTADAANANAAKKSKKTNEDQVDAVVLTPEQLAKMGM